MGESDRLAILREQRDRAQLYAQAQRKSKFYWAQRALWAEHHLALALKLGGEECERLRRMVERGEQTISCLVEIARQHGTVVDLDP